MDSTQIVDTLKQFERFLFLRKSFSNSSAIQHIGAVRRFLSSLQENPTQEIIEDYVIELKRSNASYGHIVNTMRALELFSESIGYQIKFGRPRKPQHLIKDTLTEPEIILIIAASKNIREKAILTLLAFSGLRNKEVCNLRVGDIDFANQVLRVYGGKGQKDRIACVSGTCLEILTEYLGSRNKNSGDLLFVTARNKHQYQTQDLRKLIRVVAKRTGIKKHVHPHLFRHSLATNMLKRGAHLLAIKEQLGHAFVETTMIYLHSAPQRMMLDYRMFCPEYV